MNQHPTAMKRVMAAVMLAQWLALLAFSTSEGLHRAVCDGSQLPAHDCAIATIARGHLWTTFELVAAPASPVRAVALVSSIPVTAFPTADLRLMPGRGPPFSPPSFRST